MGIHIIVSRLFLMAFSEKRRGLCATAEGAAENEDGNTFNLQILREKKKSIFSDYMTKEVNHTVLLCHLLQWGWVWFCSIRRISSPNWKHTGKDSSIRAWAFTVIILSILREATWQLSLKHKTKRNLVVKDQVFPALWFLWSPEQSFGANKNSCCLATFSEEADWSEWGRENFAQPLLI